MFSLEASGTIGGAVTAAKWKGRPYFRIKTTPSNPKTGSQVGNRQMMKFLAQDWANLAALEKASWDDDAAQLAISPFNSFIRVNMNRWRNFLPPSPDGDYGAAGTPGTVDSFTVTPGVRLAQVEITLSAAADNYGAVIFRSTTDSFVPTKSNAIASIRVDDTAAHTYVDTPLDAGTYYYAYRLFTVDGLLAAAAADVEAVVT
jgi:hypothetical protein